MAIAREFGLNGATVVLCAREEAELNRARTDLYKLGIEAHSFVCDVSVEGDVTALVAAVEQQFGGVDVLVNNAGIIKVGPLASFRIDDFEQAMNVMFWGPLRMTLAVVPAMRARRRGSIINITSIGGKVAIPHLLPYCCAKFAAVGLSEGLGPELAAAGIKVTTVVPGLLRTGSHLNAEFTGRAEDEYAWFAAGAATPLISISARRAARSIVRAAIRGDKEIILSVPADLLARFHGLAPAVTPNLLSLANRLLPSDVGSGETFRGRDIEERFKSRLWKLSTKSGKRAAESLNEVA